MNLKPLLADSFFFGSTELNLKPFLADRFLTTKPEAPGGMLKVISPPSIHSELDVRVPILVPRNFDSHGRLVTRQLVSLLLSV